MNELKDFKKQIKIFLDEIEKYLGEDERPAAQEALDILTAYYFFDNCDEIGNDYIERINGYMNLLENKLCEKDFLSFKSSVKIVLDFVDAVKPKIPKDIY